MEFYKGSFEGVLWASEVHLGVAVRLCMIDLASVALQASQGFCCKGNFRRTVRGSTWRIMGLSK